MCPAVNTPSGLNYAFSVLVSRYLRPRHESTIVHIMPTLQTVKKNISIQQSGPTNTIGNRESSLMMCKAMYFPKPINWNFGQICSTERVGAAEGEPSCFPRAGKQVVFHHSINFCLVFTQLNTTCS